MRKILEQKAQQSLRFWTINSHQHKLKSCKKLWTLILNCTEKFSSIVVNLDYVQNISNKFNIQEMSFLKIKDPSKGDKLVAEYLKVKNKI